MLSAALPPGRRGDASRLPQPARPASPVSPRALPWRWPGHPAQRQPAGVPFAAFAGSLAVALLLQVVLHTQRGTGSYTIILVGVSINAFAGAIISILVANARDDALARGAVFWLAGDLELRTWTHAAIAAGPILLGLLILGSRVERSMRCPGRRRASVTTSTAAAVACSSPRHGAVAARASCLSGSWSPTRCGPHRRQTRPPPPLSIAGGALFLVIADTIARATSVSVVVQTRRSRRHQHPGFLALRFLAVRMMTSSSTNSSPIAAALFTRSRTDRPRHTRGVVGPNGTGKSTSQRHHRPRHRTLGHGTLRATALGRLRPGSSPKSFRSSAKTRSRPTICEYVTSSPSGPGPPGTARTPKPAACARWTGSGSLTSPSAATPDSPAVSGSSSKSLARSPRTPPSCPWMSRRRRST